VDENAAATVLVVRGKHLLPRSSWLLLNNVIEAPCRPEVNRAFDIDRLEKGARFAPRA
jgi:hypothetical protein